MNRSAAEVEAEVEASRDQLDRNVEALKQKMTPGQLFDEATRVAGGAGQQIASKLVDQAKANPLPFAAIGLGLAWLIMSNGRSSSTAASVGDMSGTASDSGLKDKVQDAVQGVGQKASDMMAGARDRLSGSSGVQGLSSMASQTGQQVQRTFSQTLENEPLLIAGLAVVVGAAIGAALPSTPYEDRLMGQQRDRILNKGRDLAQSGISKAGSAAQAAYGSVKSELQAGDGRDLSQRMEAAARSGVQAARAEMQDGETTH